MPYPKIWCLLYKSIYNVLLHVKNVSIVIIDYCDLSASKST